MCVTTGVCCYARAEHEKNIQNFVWLFVYLYNLLKIDYQHNGEVMHLWYLHIDEATSNSFQSDKVVCIHILHFYCFTLNERDVKYFGLNSVQLKLGYNKRYFKYLHNQQYLCKII